ncbi:MAG TPA: LPS-assembly protein LptD [Firmicutes bacterium]|nr:LPS-assembly protein LptD [Bacillota bacterium]
MSIIVAVITVVTVVAAQGLGFPVIDMPAVGHAPAISFSTGHAYAAEATESGQGSASDDSSASQAGPGEASGAGRSVRSGGPDGGVETGRAVGAGRARLVAGEVSFDLENRIITARSNVRLLHEDVELTADYMEVNLNTNEVLAVGNVSMSKEGDRVQAQSMKYNLKSEKGTFDHALATVTDEDIKGELFVSGNRVEVDPNVIRIVSGSLTSCDLEVPHYHIEASEVTIYIDDKVIIRNVSYWEGRYKIFQWPYLVFSLKEENQLELPRFGYGSYEGWFIKTTYNYYRTDASRGKLYLDYFQRLGLGAGVKHLYDLGRIGNGFLYLYMLGNRLVGHNDIEAEVSHGLTLGRDVRADLDLKYENTGTSGGGEDKSFTSSVAINQKDESGAMNLSLKNVSRDGSVYGDTRSISFWGERYITDRIRIAADASYLDEQASDRERDRYLNYKISIEDQLPSLTFNAVVENYVKPKQPSEEEGEELKEEEEIPWNALVRLPEITITTKPLTVKPLPAPLVLKAGWGKYSENALHDGWTPSILTATRTEAGVEVPTRIVPLWGGTSGDISASLTWDGYSAIERRGQYLDWQAGQQGSGGYAEYYERYVANATVGLRSRLTQSLSLRLSYDYQGVWGWSPFVFDEQEPKGLVAATLSFRNPGSSSGFGYGHNRGSGYEWNAEVGAGYDLYYREFQDIIGKFTLSFAAGSPAGPPRQEGVSGPGDAADSTGPANPADSANTTDSANMTDSAGTANPVSPAEQAGPANLAGAGNSGNPGRKLSLDVVGRYDPNASQMRDVTGKITFTSREGWDIKAGARYSFENKALDRLESEVDVQVNKDWRIQWTVVYGGVDEKTIKRADIGITRDLHCRELSLLYSYKDQEVWLEYRIKAFPFEGIKFGLGDQGVLLGQ